MKKLKLQYRYAKEHYGAHDSWFVYPFLRSSLHKHFSTKQEKSYFYLHHAEYKEYPLKLRAARGKLLINPWADLPTHAYALGKSWKHNSRRKHQYYR